MICGIKCFFEVQKHRACWFSIKYNREQIVNNYNITVGSCPIILFGSVFVMILMLMCAKCFVIAGTFKFLAYFAFFRVIWIPCPFWNFFFWLPWLSLMLILCTTQGWEKSIVIDILYFFGW